MSEQSWAFDPTVSVYELTTMADLTEQLEHALRAILVETDLHPGQISIVCTDPGMVGALRNQQLAAQRLTGPGGRGVIVEAAADLTGPREAIVLIVSDSPAESDHLELARTAAGHATDLLSIVAANPSGSLEPVGFA